MDTQERWSEEELRELEQGDTWDLEGAETHEPVRNKRTVVSVAYQRDDFQRVAAAARSSGMKISEYIRHASLRNAMDSGHMRPQATVSTSMGGFQQGIVTMAAPQRGTLVRIDH